MHIRQKIKNEIEKSIMKFVYQSNFDKLLYVSKFIIIYISMHSVNRNVNKLA